jgi:predicted DNA-binding transcriptional regulator AlpA
LKGWMIASIFFIRCNCIIPRWRRQTHPLVGWVASEISIWVKQAFGLRLEIGH